jgi:hypothetical protein
LRCVGAPRASTRNTEPDNAVAPITLKRKVGYEIGPIDRVKVRRLDKEEGIARKDEGEAKAMDEGRD